MNNVINAINKDIEEILVNISTKEQEIDELKQQMHKLLDIKDLLKSTTYKPTIQEEAEDEEDNTPTPLPRRNNYPEDHKDRAKYNEEMCTSIYKGVYQDTRTKKWVAQGYINGNNKVQIGRYESEVQAGIEYDKWVLKAKGPTAYTNFPKHNYGY